MKQVVRVAAISVIGALSASGGAQAYDWSSRTAFMAEWQQQSIRIQDGRRSGMLSRAEARMLRRGLDALGGMPFNTATSEMLSQHSKKIAAYKSGTGE